VDCFRWDTCPLGREGFGVKPPAKMCNCKLLLLSGKYKQDVACTSDSDSTFCQITLDMFTQVLVNESPIWKRKDVAADDSKGTLVSVRCVECGRRGQSAPQLNDVQQAAAAALATSTSGGSASTGSLVPGGNDLFSRQLKIFYLFIFM